MPLSKDRNRDRMRRARLVQPSKVVVQPKVDALQSKSKGIGDVTGSKLSPLVEAVQPIGYSKTQQVKG